MIENEEQTDIFNLAIKKLCKLNNISPRKPRFELIDNLVVINIKNHLKDGVDSDCFFLSNLVYQIIGPLGIKFHQQLMLFPNSRRVASIAVSFKKKDYDTLNRNLREGNIPI
ncbi:hypothetical protein [Niallia circulans]|uniref:hypothetical protein n=1 Tax=Niallia circulans TaxID=1397 RepID=UPI0026EC74C7|nr:hypothetical protein [Niallia circulans]